MRAPIQVTLFLASTSLATAMASSAYADPLFNLQTIDVTGAASGSTTPFAINNSGVIAGTYEDPAIGYRVFERANGSVTTVEPAGAVNGSSFVSLNNSGQIVGFANTATPPNYGFYYLASGGNFAAFPPAGTTVPADASYSWYNDNGAVAGQSGNTAFIAQGNTITQVAPPTTTSTSINAINNSGSAVGGFFPAVMPSPTANQAAFLFANGIYTTLSPPGSTFTEATGISDNGVVVGYFDMAQVVGANGILVTPIVGFTYANGVYTDYSVPGEAETELFGINDAGQVVGYYSDEQGNAHAFEANTVPEPGSLLIAATGLLGLAGIRRRNRIS